MTQDTLKSAFGAQTVPSSFQLSPDPLFPTNNPLPSAFPLSAVPKKLQRCIEGIQQNTGAHLTLVSNSVLSAINLSVQGLYNVQIRNHDPIPLSCFFITVASSGQRKSTVLKKTYSAILKHERNAIDQYMLDKEAWKISQRNNGRKSQDICSEIPKPLLPYRIFAEPTTAGLMKFLQDGQPTIGIISAEGGQLIGGYSLNQDNLLQTITTLSALWDDGIAERIRVTEDAMKLFGKRCMVHLMAQPEIILPFLKNPIVDRQGFLSRLLVAVAPKQNFNASYEQSSDQQDAINHFDVELTNILMQELPLKYNTCNVLNPPSLLVNDDLTKLCMQYVHSMHEKANQTQFLAVEKFLFKTLDHVLRLAATIQLFEDINANELQYEYLKAAMHVFEYYVEQQKHLLQKAEPAEALILAQQVLDWMRVNCVGPYIALSDVYLSGISPKIRDKHTANKIMHILHDHGYVKPEPHPQKINGKIKQHVWAICWHKDNFKLSA